MSEEIIDIKALIENKEKALKELNDILEIIKDSKRLSEKKLEEIKEKIQNAQKTLNQ